MTEVIRIPKLRFSEFKETWTIKKVADIVDRIVIPVDVDKKRKYREIGIRSHGKGIFYKEPVYGVSLGNKRVFWVKENVFVVNIVFAWEQAVAKTTKNENGLIASHRFPMYLPREGILDLDFILYFFLSKKGKNILELASPGGAGRNKTLGQKKFANSKVIIPDIYEQQKIAAFLTAVDRKLIQLERKKTLLEDYKKGVMQQLFSQKIRFKNDNGKPYPDWEEKRLGEIGDFKTSSIDKKIVEGEKLVNLINYMDVYNRKELSNSNTDGLMRVSAKDNQIEGNNLKKGDILFTPSSETPKDIGHSVVIFEDLENTVYSYHLLRYRPKINIDILFSHYFCNITSVFKQLSRFATGSTRFTISIDNFSKVEVKLPCLAEQTKIAAFLSSIDKKIALVNTQLENTRQFKKGLLQQLFV